MSSPVDSLLSLAHELGSEARALAILGEGNVSIPGDPGTFWVKASGSSLSTLRADQVTHVHTEMVLQALDEGDLDDVGVKKRLETSRCDSTASLPSVETFLHAVALTEGEAACVGHVHPISVLSLVCAKGGMAAFQRHLFPDAIVVCGRHIASIPYLDPGLALAVAFRDEIRRFKNEHGSAPRVLMMENHGPVALGRSPSDVLNILLMLDKWAKILLGTIAAGGPQYLEESQSDRIDGRPDEHHRRKQIEGLR